MKEKRGGRGRNLHAGAGEDGDLRTGAGEDEVTSAPVEEKRGKGWRLSSLVKRRRCAGGGEG